MNSLKPTIKSIVNSLIDIILKPSSYRYHFFVSYFMRKFSCKQSNMAISLFSSVSTDDFASGNVFNYKTVVAFDGENLSINRDNSASRMHDIFLKNNILDYLQVSPFGSLLEIGCEAGQNLLEIREMLPNMHLSGCDISPIALGHAEKAGFSVKIVDLLCEDSLEVYRNDEFDYVLVSHVFEHLASKSLCISATIRLNILQHIFRIARVGFVFTTASISQSYTDFPIDFIGNSRVALQGFSVLDLKGIDISSFFVTSNISDQSLSVVVRKCSAHDNI